MTRADREALTRASKFLSFVLRHKPDAIGLALDAEGWAEVAELVAKADIPLSPALIAEVVETSDKKRFALSADRRLIRAVQGHSITVDLGLAPFAPPETLYHGTATRFLDAIRAEGLRPRSRQYVHLSADAATATTVGARHGKPVVLTIAAGALHAGGQPFFQAQNGVWLTGPVAAAALGFPEG